MTVKFSIITMCFVAVATIFSCKEEKVLGSGKALNAAKVEKLGPDTPLFKNMQGKWVDDSNPNHILELKDGKFFSYNNGQKTNEAEFVFYKKCPEGCYPDNMGGTTPCFSLKSDKDLRCFVMQGLSPNVSMSFAEISSDTLRTETYKKLQ